MELTSPAMMDWSLEKGKKSLTISEAVLYVCSITRGDYNSVNTIQRFK